MIFDSHLGEIIQADRCRGCPQDVGSFDCPSNSLFGNDRPRTKSFGVGRREGHDSSPYYGRALASLQETKDHHTSQPAVANEVFEHSAEKMTERQRGPDGDLAPYHVGKDYDSDASFEEYLGLDMGDTARVGNPLVVTGAYAISGP
ncbi:MAG: hypothetical protein ACRDVP_04395 [Acidimicrobiales bacterium]